MSWRFGADKDITDHRPENSANSLRKYQPATQIRQNGVIPDEANQAKILRFLFRRSRDSNVGQAAHVHARTLVSLGKVHGTGKAHIEERTPAPLIKSQIIS